MFTLNPQSRFHLYWLDCRPGAVADAIRPLQERNISSVNVGYALATFLKNKTSSKYLYLEVEEFLQQELEYTAKPVDASGIPVVAVYNLGILLEPELHLDPARLLKDISKRIGIILLWEDAFEAPGRFHWGSREREFHLDFSDAEIKPITLDP